MRTKPSFGKKETVESRDKDDPWGCIRIPLTIVISYFVLKAIVRYTSGSGSNLDQVICYGALLIFLSIMFLGFVQWINDGISEGKEKQRWKNTCQSLEAAILSRSGNPGGSYDDEYGIPHRVRSHYHLTLRLPNQAETRIDVSESVYAKLEQKDTVRIYYKPESPWIFMLEEEF